MKEIITFLHKIGELKELKRKGWERRNILNPESVADHSYRMAIIALAISKKFGVDEDKCIKMALIHDVAECIIGDITPHDGISKKEKHEMEHAAIKNLTKDIDNTEIVQLWEEYEEQKSPEAKIVCEIDKIEMLMQAFEYEQKHKEKVNLEEFWPYVEERLHSPQLIEMFKLLKEAKEKDTTKYPL